jgi:hypothetical protein
MSVTVYSALIDRQQKPHEIASSVDTVINFQD